MDNVFQTMPACAVHPQHPTHRLFVATLNLSHCLRIVTIEQSYKMSSVVARLVLGVLPWILGSSTPQTFFPATLRSTR
jgi:hypothetical protein